MIGEKYKNLTKTENKMRLLPNNHKQNKKLTKTENKMSLLPNNHKQTKTENK